MASKGPYVFVFSNNQRVLKVGSPTAKTWGDKSPSTKHKTEQENDKLRRLTSALMVGCTLMMEAVANGFAPTTDKDLEEYEKATDDSVHDRCAGPMHEDDLASMSWLPSWGLGDLSYYGEEASY